MLWVRGNVNGPHTQRPVTNSVGEKYEHTRHSRICATSAQLNFPPNHPLKMISSSHTPPTRPPGSEPRGKKGDTADRQTSLSIFLLSVCVSGEGPESRLIVTAVTEQHPHLLKTHAPSLFAITPPSCAGGWMRDNYLPSLSQSYTSILIVLWRRIR